MPTLWSRMSAAYYAFREPSLISDPIKAALDGSDFGDFDSRRLRYAMYWGFFENTSYASIHAWAKTYKVQAALYEYIRNIKNPSYQLGEFWKSHLWGGQLDLAAGDGKDQNVPTCLPIITDNDSIREPLGQIWRWSNWQLLKDLVTLWGTVFGDVVLVVADDLEKEKVCIRAIHPGTVKTIDKDAYGNVKAYEINEDRQDPASKTEKIVTYRETAERDGENVIYRTYKDKMPYVWPGQTVSEWVQPYGFIPMVHIQHNDVGIGWGWSEIHPLRSRIQEVDDLASKLSDQIRKEIDPFWLFSGVTPPTTTPEARKPTLTGTSLLNRPMLGREAVNVLYAPENAKAYPLVGDLNIVDAAGYISGILDDIKQNCPELMNLWETGNDASGRAIRITRQPVETKVKQRRANYDDALVRIQQMALSIGGLRGYFPFSLDSYEAGKLDHSIGDRPIFPPDPLDKGEIDKLFWDTAKLATEAGMALDAYLIDAGWDEERLATLKQSPEYQAKLKLMEMATLASRQEETGNEDDNSGQGNNQNDNGTDSRNNPTTRTTA